MLLSILGDHVGSIDDLGIRNAKGVQGFRRWSLREGVGTGAYEVMWPGATATNFWPTEPIELEIVSSSALDKPGSAGVHTILLDLLNAEYHFTQELVTLDGDTPVTIPNGPYIRFQGATSRYVGTHGGSNLGNLSIRNAEVGKETEVLGYVPIGKGMTQPLTFTVPAGHTLLVMDNQASTKISNTKRDSANIRAYARRTCYSESQFCAKNEIFGINGVTGTNFDGSGRARGMMVEKTDFWLEAIGVGDTADVYCEVSGLLVRNDPPSQ